MAISLIFSITWLPLNVLNLTLDLYNPFKLPRDKEMMLIIYAACHLFGMSSACANPFLYGWFNENFRNEFKLIFAAPSRLLCPVNAAVDGRRHRSSTTAFTSVADTMSTMGQSKLRRISSTQSTINTNNMRKNSALGLDQTLSTVQEISETTADHQNAEGTKLLSRSAYSPLEGQGKADCDAYFQERALEMDDKIIHPISTSILEYSSTLETHL